MAEAPAPSGYDAMGRPVPMTRRDAALAAIRDMVPGVSTEDAMALVERVARHLEDDQPYKALREATGAPIARPISTATPSYEPTDGLKLDLTGGYRLLATLLCD